jgi:MFS family permease
VVGPRWLSSWWVIGGFAVILLLVLGWKFVADPSLSAPTRDPAWYTWRANVIMDSSPVEVVTEWGPDGMFAGGYRVTVPIAGALLQRVAGTDTYSFSTFLMIGLPVLTGLALGAGLFRSRRDPLAMLITMLATAGLFLSTPYIGYLDNIMVLFLLALLLPFLHAARTSWGARVALFLIGVAAAYTHPTTCVVFGVVLMAVFGFHFLTSRFSLGKALNSDGPMLLSTGIGMIVGLAGWFIGIWGAAANIADAALPPPYTKAFFSNRLDEWVGTLQPAVTVPFVLIAIVSTIWLARRTRRPTDAYDMTAIWWLLAFAGVFTVFTSAVVPYYRFMNASAAPMALVGLGAFVAVRWFLRLPGKARIAGVLGALLVVGSLGWLLQDGLQNRWVSETNQWANQDVRSSLAAVHEVVVDAGDRPIVLVVNQNDRNDEFDTNTAYGWAKTYTNVFRTGIPGDREREQVTYLGTVENFFADGEYTDGASDGYDEASKAHAGELARRLEEFPEPPLVFLVGQYYQEGLCNSVGCPDDPAERSEFVQGLLDETIQGADGVEVGPDVYVLQGPGTYAPPPEVVEAARQAGEVEAARLQDHAGAAARPLHTLWVLFGLFLLVVLPGWLAAPFFELRDTPSRIALIPGMGVVLTLLSGIGILMVWRGPLTTPKSWAAVALACGIGAALRFAGDRIMRPFESVAGFFTKLFSQFSNRDFSVLMGTQFLVQAGQGVIQGAIAKSIAFGGKEGFDVQNVPSADYLLKVVLLLYVPYTLLSPFIGVFIDRFQRKRVVWWTNLIVAAVVAVVAAAVLLPLGEGTSEGHTSTTLLLILGLLVAQAAVRVILAVKSAAMPDVLSGKDLLQGNGLSQAGGALFQVVGIAFAIGAGAALPGWVIAVLGAGVLVIAAVVSKQMRHLEAVEHATSFLHEVSRVIKNIVAGIKEVISRPPAALGLSSFQMLRYQFWGFGLFIFGLYAKNLVAGGGEKADTLALILVGVGGLVGGGLGLVLAQKLKDRIPPIRLLLASMLLLGVGTIVFGGIVSVLGFALLLFVGSFSFFLGKISADTITQQSMPDDFRGRAFALFDIAYNLGFIIPAFILSAIWIEGDATRTRVILVVSGIVFLILTALVATWARRIRDQFAPQDDLVDAGG